MANLISLTSFTALDPNNTDPRATGAATSVIINTKNILSVKTRATAFRTTGVTDVVYELPVNRSRQSIVLVVTEAASAVVTAANA